MGAIREVDWRFRAQEVCKEYREAAAILNAKGEGSLRSGSGGDARRDQRHHARHSRGSQAAPARSATAILS